MLLSALAGIVGATLSSVVPEPAPNDTLTASPWVLSILASWHPTVSRAWCVTSDARWTKFYFIRHLEETNPAIGCDGRPMLLQLPVCPPLPPSTLPAYIIVQCGQNDYMIYTRARGSAT
jgi:hypothetical protein